MFIGRTAGSTCVLDYALFTRPVPLQVDYAGTGAAPTGNGRIVVTVSNSTGNTVNIASLTFTVEVGPDPKDLTRHPEGIRPTAAPDDWTLSPDGGTFTALPKDATAGYIPFGAGTSYAFTFDTIDVNTAVGVTTVTIAESQYDKPPVKHTSFLVGKAPYGFEFGNFRPQTVDQADAKGHHAAVRPGDRVTLLWEGSQGATYEIVHDLEPPCAVAPGTYSWQSGPVYRDTTFHLRATLTTPGGTVQVSHYLDTTVTVLGPVTLGTQQDPTDLLVTGTSTTWGDSRTDGRLTVSGEAVVEGDLAVSGVATLDRDTTVHGDLTVSGTTVLEQDTAVRGRLTARLSGLLGPAEDLWTPTDEELAAAAKDGKPRTRPVDANSTDGFVLGALTVPLVEQGSVYLVARISCSVTGQPDVGAHVIQQWGLGFMTMNDSFLLPVPAGTGFTLGFAALHVPETDKPAFSLSFRWIPIGTT
ncbi:hypothetical protein ACFVVL_00110 [Kitasatospora sp. NPDC058115]|uniref:hypothetical protein n=1 Tax=Kitasatospora sp. NPDC058115 TaxID=3346347 RepID=UPI0036D97515